MFCFCGLYSLTINAQVQYTEVSKALGIEHSFTGGTAGSGVSFVDFNQDGKDDLTLGTGNDDVIKFYLNNGKYFEAVDLGITDSVTNKQVLWVDFDNDNDLDFFVSNYNGVTRLYENIGDLELVDITEKAGLVTESQRVIGVSFADYNRDGWLDIYYAERAIVGLTGMHQNRLFRNNGDGTFTDRTLFEGVSDHGRVPFCSIFSDFNNDNWPDIYIANDRTSRNTLFQNENGFFVDVSEISESDHKIEAMCTSVSDYDLDGDMDLYVSNTIWGNIFMRNDFSPELLVPTFTDIAEVSGTSVFGHCWAASFLDFNNDALEDLYVCNSLIGIDSSNNRLLKHDSIGHFSAVEEGMEKDTVVSYSNAIGDLNQDGFPDIIVSNKYPHNSYLWENVGGENNWLKVKLEGVLSNKDAIGSLVRVYFDNLQYTKQMTCGSGYLGQNSKTLLFGLKDFQSIDSVVVQWPTGHEDKYLHLEANQTYEFLEGETTNGEIQIDTGVNILIPEPMGKDTMSSDSITSNTLVQHNDDLELDFNITSDLLEVKFQNSKNLPIYIYNASGKLVKRTWNNSEINISGFIPGHYYVMVKIENSLITKSFIKI